MVVTNDRELAIKLRRFSSLGYSCVGAVPGESKIDKKLIVNPEFIRHVEYGFNYRLNEISSAVALAQLEKLDTFVYYRQLCGRKFAEAIKDFPFLAAQKTPENYEHSYWAFVIRLADDRIKWTDFYEKFCELGGDGFYGAWRLSYQEPFFEKLIPAENRQCPVAEATQKRLIQLKTNYGDEAFIDKQAEILRKTAEFFAAQLA